MIDLAQLKTYYTNETAGGGLNDKYILKEYIQIMVLDFLSASEYVRKIAFIGGTNLRLIHGIDRFSEDLDFDCKDFTETDFMSMTDGILLFLKRSGFRVECRDRNNSRLSAFRRNLYFPELLFEMKLSGHREERFLIKVEAQDQGVDYEPVLANINRMGFFFPIPVPPDAILCAMKLSALLSRSKGRDFYDAMFLLVKTEPDYAYLSAKHGIMDKDALKTALLHICDTTDIKRKSQDFSHLLLDKKRSDKILRFREFVEAELCP